MQTLALKTISQKAAAALKTSTAIKAWCLANYSKPSLIVYRGVNEDPAQRPSPENGPTAIVAIGTKREGDELEELHYCARVTWAIRNETQRADANGVIVCTGEEHIDDLGQLILAELIDVSDNYPVSQFDYEIIGNEYPNFWGFVEINWTAPALVGGANIPF